MCPSSRNYHFLIMIQTDTYLLRFCIYVLLPYRWMYWTDGYTIERASMDGTSRTLLHSSSPGYVTGITVDYDTQTLYWIDSSLRMIESSHVNGSNRVLMASGGLIYSPQEITFYNGYLYWTDSSYRRIISTPVSPPTNVSSYVSGSYSYTLYGIRTVYTDRQPDGTISKNLIFAC